MNKKRIEQRKCVLIPVYQEESHIAFLIKQVLAFVPDVFVVDDGSTDATADEARRAGAAVLSHPYNLGKGAALNTGFRHVLMQGFDYVICFNADGQYDPADIPRFINAYIRTGIPVLIGNRMVNPFAVTPPCRLYNGLMRWLLSRFTGCYVPDTQCGFRLYRCDVLPFVKALESRSAAESEILLQVACRGIRIDSVPIGVMRKACKNRKRRLSNPIRDMRRFATTLWRHQCRRHTRGKTW